MERLLGLRGGDVELAGGTSDQLARQLPPNVSAEVVDRPKGVFEQVDLPTGQIRRIDEVGYRAAGLVVGDLLAQLQPGDVVEGGVQVILDVAAQVPGLAQGGEPGERAGRADAGT